MELAEALRSTGAVRDFSDRPVEDDVVYRVLDTARFAPSGGNRQAWRIVVLKDPATRAGIRDLYLHGWYHYVAMTQAGLVPWAPVTDRVKEDAAREMAPEIAARLPEGGPAHPSAARRSREVRGGGPLRRSPAGGAYELSAS
jgi:nitroreductase